MLRNALWFVVLCGLLAGCNEQAIENKSEGVENKSEGVAKVDSVSPTGFWTMYAGSQSGTRTAEDFKREITILVLEDSTYTLTMMQPDIQLNFVEKGSVEYDTRNKTAKFSVFSATGIDFSGPEPRKLVDVDQVVPWQRDPGTVYLMTYSIDAEQEQDILQLSMEDTEDSFFVRMKPSEKGSTFDVKMVPGQTQ